MIDTFDIEIKYDSVMHVINLFLEDGIFVVGRWDVVSRDQKRFSNDVCIKSSIVFV